MREQWQKSLQECKVEEGASDDDLIPFAKHSKLETYKSKCLLACVNEKSGFTVSTLISLIDTKKTEIR